MWSDIIEIMKLSRDIIRAIRDIGKMMSCGDYDTAREIVTRVETAKAAGKSAWEASKKAGPRR